MLNIFIGDSHTAGYTGFVGGNNHKNWTIWQDNNYAKIYAELTGEKSIIYANPGANHDSYANWLKFLLDKYDNVDKAFICLRGFNRFTIAGWKEPIVDPLPVDHFTIKMEEDENCVCYMDQIIKDGFLQLYQKTIPNDYDNYPGILFEPDEGLTTPDLRKNTFMEVKTFMELNTHLEIQNFLKNVFIWDNLCRIKNVKLHIFCIRNHAILPNKMDYYGDLTNTIVAKNTVEDYFSAKNINHEDYLKADGEHYNKKYHTMIANDYLKDFLKNG